MSKEAAILLILGAFAAGGILFHTPPPPALPALTDAERAVLAEISAEPGPRAEVCERIFDLVLDAAHAEEIDEYVSRQD